MLLKEFSYVWVWILTLHLVDGSDCSVLWAPGPLSVHKKYMWVHGTHTPISNTFTCFLSMQIREQKVSAELRSCSNRELKNGWDFVPAPCKSKAIAALIRKDIMLGRHAGRQGQRWTSYLKMIRTFTQHLACKILSFNCN